MNIFFLLKIGLFRRILWLMVVRFEYYRFINIVVYVLI